MPYDLAAASRYLERRVGPDLHRPLHAAAEDRRRWTCWPGSRARPRTSIPSASAHARTFREFDECLTAPLHGFAGADDYYLRASALPYLARIAVPTLCLSSEDDPFFPGDDVYRARDAASADVRFEITAWGGHTGFVSGAWPWRPHYWAEERAVDWLRAHAAHPAALTLTLSRYAGEGKQLPGPVRRDRSARG